MYKRQIVQRSQRQSAVAAAAYQSGEKLFCEYDQQVKHYPEKRGIVPVSYTHLDVYKRQYYIPDLKLPEEHRPIGKYGRLHREYLREVQPARLNTLTLTGDLWTYLADLNEQAQERLDTIMEQMKAAEGVTEELKRTSQMEWVQRLSLIHIWYLLMMQNQPEISCRHRGLA